MTAAANSPTLLDLIYFFFNCVSADSIRPQQTLELSDRGPLSTVIYTKRPNQNQPKSWQWELGCDCFDLMANNLTLNNTRSGELWLTCMQSTRTILSGLEKPEQFSSRPFKWTFWIWLKELFCLDLMEVKV